MKKDSEAAAKKKPKVNAAQLRVQKGTSTGAGAGALGLEHLAQGEEPARLGPAPDPDLRGPSRSLDLPLDITELDLPTNIKTIFPDPADILNFELTIDPDEGACADGSLRREVCGGREGQRRFFQAHHEGCSGLA